jgi:hypothetical protein
MNDFPTHLTFVMAEYLNVTFYSIARATIYAKGGLKECDYRYYDGTHHSEDIKSKNAAEACFEDLVNQFYDLCKNNIPVSCRSSYGDLCDEHIDLCNNTICACL